jgi:hypothetical protein
MTVTAVYGPIATRSRSGTSAPAWNATSYERDVKEGPLKVVTDAPAEVGGRNADDTSKFTRPYANPAATPTQGEAHTSRRRYTIDSMPNRVT